MKKKKHHRKRKDESRDLRQERANEQKVIKQTWSLAEPLCESEGLELIQVEYQREPASRILRLYVDKPGGIGIDDCIAVSRQLGDILAVNLEKFFSFFTLKHFIDASRAISLCWLVIHW